MPAAQDLLRCPKCQGTFEHALWQQSYKTCVHCGFHYRLSVADRIQYHLDPGSFKAIDHNLTSTDPLEWVDDLCYPQMLDKAKSRTGSKESITTGTARIGGLDAQVGIFDFRFLGGTLGSVTGELVCRMLEKAGEQKMPVVLFTMSGGARMQEGMHSLMQMAKIAVALKRFQRSGGFLITVMCDPTTGGVAASIGFLGDVVVAEPGALVGFAGPRVIVEAIGQELPDGFQQSENRVQQGLVDAIVKRQDLTSALTEYLSLAMAKSE